LRKHFNILWYQNEGVLAPGTSLELATVWLDGRDPTETISEPEKSEYIFLLEKVRLYSLVCSDWSYFVTIKLGANELIESANVWDAGTCM